MLATITDVSERQCLDEQLGQAQKMEAIGQLASGIAHDFSNMLTVVKGYCQLMLEDLHPEAFTSALVGWLAEQLEGELLLVVRAGYHLQLEAKDRPELREIHLEWAAAVQGVAEEVLKRAGSAQPRADAHILATVLDGLRLEEIASPRPGAEQRLRPVVGRLLAALTSPPP